MPIIEDLKRLVEFESPSEDLEACHGVIKLAMEICNKELTIKAEIIEENGRPVLWWGSKNPEIVLLAHLDTVWPKGSFLPLWDESGDVVKGPGIFDMKTGFIQGLYALKEVGDAQNKVALIATTDEELGSQTSRELIKRVSTGAKAVLVLEASLNGKVKTGRKGTAMYQIQILGRASHAGLEPEKGINTTIEIATIIQSVVALENPEHGTTVVPTTLNSGSTTNTVPALATLDLDIRSYSTDDLIRVDKAINSLTTQNVEAKIIITGGINRPPLEVSSTMALYEKLEAVAKSIGMGPIGHACVGGASDGNFAAAAGAPTLDGLGAIGAGAHASHEQILLSTIPSQVKLLTAFLKELTSE